MAMMVPEGKVVKSRNYVVFFGHRVVAKPAWKRATLCWEPPELKELSKTKIVIKTPFVAITIAIVGHQHHQPTISRSDRFEAPFVVFPSTFQRPLQLFIASHPKNRNPIDYFFSPLAATKETLCGLSEGDLLRCSGSFDFIVEHQKKTSHCDGLEKQQKSEKSFEIK